MHSYIPELRNQLSKGKITRREFIRYATLLGVSFSAAQIIAACQPEAETPAATAAPTSTSRPTEMEAPTETSAPAQVPTTSQMPLKFPDASPTRGGTLRYAHPVRTPDHPARYASSQQANPMGFVLEYLTYTDENVTTHPWLLDRWEASDDLKTWTLYLREGIKFNNGDDLTSDDVVFSMEQWLDPEIASSMVGLLTSLSPTGIEKVDTTTVRLHLDDPEIGIPEFLYHYPAQILNHRTFEGDILAAPHGTGPFSVEEHIPEERVVLTARDDYWRIGADGNPLPYLDGITFIDLGDDRAAWTSAFKSGQIDTFYFPTVAQWEVFKDDPDAIVLPIQSANHRVLRMRADREPWTDNNVRMALKLCQDRDKILALAQLGEGVVGQDHAVPPMYPDYCPVDTPTYDPESAKALLADAGYPNGLDVEMAVNNSQPETVRYAEILKEDAEPAGFRIALNLMPSSNYWDVWTEVDLGITSWGGRPLSTIILSLAYSCDKDGNPVPWNETHWCDEEFNQLLNQAKVTLDVDERRKIMCNLERIQQERGTIGVGFFLNKWDIFRKEFQGATPHPEGYPYPMWYELWREGGAT